MLCALCPVIARVDRNLLCLGLDGMCTGLLGSLVYLCAVRAFRVRERASASRRAVLVLTCSLSLCGLLTFHAQVCAR